MKNIPKLIQMIEQKEGRSLVPVETLPDITVQELLLQCCSDVSVSGATLHGKFSMQVVRNWLGMPACYTLRWKEYIIVFSLEFDPLIILQ